MSPLDLLRIARRRVILTAAICFAVGLIAAVVHAAETVVAGAPCEFIGIVKDVGFPIFVALFLLVRGDKTHRDLTAAVKAFTLQCPYADRSKVEHLE